jgi:hypothetical protein
MRSRGDVSSIEAGHVLPALSTPRVAGLGARERDQADRVALRSCSLQVQ